MNKYLLLFISFLLFTSCSNEEVLIDPNNSANVIIETSSAMRTAFEILLENASKSPARTTKNPEDLCFQFIYPITLAYNTEEVVEVSSYDVLLEILFQESLEKHITGIGFPFEVQIRETEEIKTINDEAEFRELINTCGYDALDYAGVVDIAETCFEVSYPISLVVNDERIEFESEAAAQSYFQAEFATIVSVTVAYPLHVILRDTEEIIAINDDYELIYLINETCGIS